MNLLPFFEWLEGSALGSFMKDFAATFAIVEAIHLTALAHKFFTIALIALLVTGFMMLAGVATKCYHNPFYWTKMIALAVGILFAFTIRRPLLAKDHAQINPWTLKLMALASISVWFLVAASGRWIGFSG